MCCTAHQVTFAAPVRLTARVSCQAACHCSYETSATGCQVYTAGVVDQDVEAAEGLAGLVDHAAHRVRVGQVGLDHHVPAARQAVKQIGAGRPAAVVHRHAVALLRERLGDGAADAA